jgi:hypothetical protein
MRQDASVCILSVLNILEFSVAFSGPSCDAADSGLSAAISGGHVGGLTIFKIWVPVGTGTVTTETV